jgi:RNA polymerase sigma-70 factor, ECF subfamily
MALREVKHNRDDELNAENLRAALCSRPVPHRSSLIRPCFSKGCLTPETSSGTASITATANLGHCPNFCGNRDRADDFVQETLLRALANINTFRSGTNLHAWLFTILRNLVRSDYRKRRREIEDTDGGYLDGLKSPPEQHSRLELEEVRAALTKLPSSQREVLLLVGASGFTYEQAAAICEISVGTVKSRISRARRRLVVLLALDSVDKFGPDPTTRAVFGHERRG